MAAKQGKGRKKDKGKKAKDVLALILASVEAMSTKLDKLEKMVESLGFEPKRQGARSPRGDTGPESLKGTPAAGGSHGQGVAKKKATRKKSVAGRVVAKKAITRKTAARKSAAKKDVTRKKAGAGNVTGKKTRQRRAATKKVATKKTRASRR
jgi:hypothetical protein